MADKQKKSGLKPKLQKAKAKFFKTYYSNPAKDLKIIAITGTNGRDITAHFVQEIIKQRDNRAGLIIEPQSTSDLYKQLFKIWKSGTDYAVVSVDSRALANHFFYGMPIHAAVITDDINNSPVAGAPSDDAKAILFNTKPDFSILNRDDANFRVFVEYPSKTATFSYGRDRSADLKVTPGKIYKQGAEASLNYNSERFDVATYVTDPNAYLYMAAAATTAFALGFRSDAIVDGIASYEPKETNTNK
jgi:UDP-N-acetylmuramyl tripeptide synthase